MRGELSPDETELLALTDSTLAKLRTMTDAEFVMSWSCTRILTNNILL